MRVVASAEAVARIHEGGGLLFVWPFSSRGPRLVLTVLVCSLDPPHRALDFRRIDNDLFTLFLHPNIDSLPTELWVELRGRHPRLCVYWNGLAFVG
jgi:hypothetical protein